ncbi:MAG: DUF86 domain-containing protein [Candidatus Omnitrophota bacterium]
MSERDLSIYVKDIIENMEKSEEFVKKLTCKEFIKDEKTHYAVVRCIEIIGEAAKHVPQIMRKKYPEIPWKDMAGMRDKIVHFYFGLNLEKIWLVVKEDMRALKPLLKKILKEI